MTTAREALEEAQKAMKLLEDLTACGADDDYVSGVQKKIADALAGLTSSGDLEVREALEVFAKAADAFERMPIKDAEEWFIWTRSSNTPEVESLQITVGDLRRARSVLASLQEGGDRGGDSRDSAIEECARAIEAYKRDASFDDSGVGALELNSHQANLAAVVRALSASPARPGGVGCVYRDSKGQTPAESLLAFVDGEADPTSTGD